MLSGNNGIGIIKKVTITTALSVLMSGIIPPSIATAKTIGELNEAIARIEETIQTREQIASETRESLSSSIRDAYKTGDLEPSSELNAIVMSDNLADLIANSQYLDAVNKKYVTAITSAQNALNELNDAKETLADLKAIKESQVKARENADNMHFCQWGEDYSDIQYYGGTIATAGCGLCAYTVAINILKGTDYTPATMLPVCGDWEGLVHYPDLTAGTPDGTTHAEWTKKYFDVDMSLMDNSVEALRDVLSDGNSVVIVLARGYSFKYKTGGWRYTNGHYICLYRCDDKGFYAQDSSGQGEEGRAVYYADDEMGEMLATGTFVKMSN